MNFVARLTSFLLIGILVLSVEGCVTGSPPVEEWTMARAALDAARSVEAAKHSPGNWHQAEEAFRKAQILYSDRNYLDAREMFARAKIAAEKAENAARLIRHKNGEVL